MDGGEPLRLTHDPADDSSPAWSPDGRYIAFVRGAAIYTISPLGGAERKVTGAKALDIAWTPDGKSIAFNDGSPDGSGPVIAVNLETGQRSRLSHPPSAVGGDSGFSFSPDGKRLAVSRRVSLQTGGGLYVLDVPESSPRRLGVPADFIYHTIWTADGKDLVVEVERGGTLALWRAPVESGEAARIPGLDDGARTPAISAASHRLAYARSVSDENIWILSGGTSKQIIASTRRDFNPQFSPDETKIAFSSDRTEGWEIYVSDAGGGHVLQLTSFGNAVADGVRWSPDGREIVFAAMLAGNRDLYIVSAEGGAVRRLTTELSDDGRPSFSRDGSWIYFRCNRSGKDEIWKMPHAGGAATQVTQGGGFEALETLDGKTLYFLRARAIDGLWSMPAGGGAAQPVADLESVNAGMWGVTEDGVCYLQGSRRNTAKPILCWKASTRKVERMGIVEKGMFTSPPSFSVSRDGRRFLWNQTDHQDSDLVLVENFR